jgi:hypothetical protein
MMNKALLSRFLTSIMSENDSEALLGLRGAQDLFKTSGARFDLALNYALDNFEKWASAPQITPPATEPQAKPAVDLQAKPAVETQIKSAVEPPAQPVPAETVTAAAPVSAFSGGFPDIRSPRAGVIEIIQAGKIHGDIHVLPGLAAADATHIGETLKDAIVAAIINKSRFKLKLADTKNNRGEILETTLQAEYDRADMSPVKIWVNNRGEVGGLAVILRKAVSVAVPELVIS